MRLTIFMATLLLAACLQRKQNPPPTDRFYFPSGVHHARTGPTGEGVLYVVSSNFDRRYDTGMMTAVDLDAVGLPAFPAQVGAAGPALVTDLKVAQGGRSVVMLANFGGDVGVQRLPQGIRMFIPSRSEEQKLMVVQANGLDLSCVPTTTSDGGTRPAPADPRDCGEVGASLVEAERTMSGVPRADSPMSITVSPDGKVAWITSGRHADSPRFSMTNLSDYVVRIPTDRLTVDTSAFVRVGPGSTHAVVSGQRWTYFSGRFPSGAQNPPLVRLVDDRSDANGNLPVLFPRLEQDVAIAEARGIALSSHEDRLYLAARLSGVSGDDFLLTATVLNPGSDAPQVLFRSTVPVPREPQMVKAIGRGMGRGDLVVVACSGAGSLVIYDEERGDTAAVVDGVGLQPSSFAIDLRANGARIYVTDFTSGQVAVIDIPNLDFPQDARLVGRLGASQVCLTRNFLCDAGTP